MFAVAIAVILGAVFYGLNNTADPSGRHVLDRPEHARRIRPIPPRRPGMRDVTPRSNTQPGMTTGAAPANPQTPPSTAIPRAPQNKARRISGSTRSRNVDLTSS